MNQGTRIRFQIFSREKAWKSQKELPASALEPAASGKSFAFCKS
jgi:hypothetical protein